MSSKIGGQDVQVRPLHFIWICDCSGSMAKHGKIDALKQAIRAAIPDMRATAAKFPRAEYWSGPLNFPTAPDGTLRGPLPWRTTRGKILALAESVIRGKHSPW
jgi:hypothetical protein